jgi:acyl-CoA reductase-like NAD-dependent aldehyde dehydrogenase
MMLISPSRGLSSRRICHLDATAVMLNEHPLFRVDWMPFAGARQSGLGVAGIAHTMKDMRTEKMMVWRWNAH